MSPVAGIAVSWSAVNEGHVAFVVPLAHGLREVVQPFDLLSVQRDAVGGGVLRRGRRLHDLMPGIGAGTTYTSPS